MLECSVPFKKVPSCWAVLLQTRCWPARINASRRVWQRSNSGCGISHDSRQSCGPLYAYTIPGGRCSPRSHLGTRDDSRRQSLCDMQPNALHQSPAISPQTPHKQRKSRICVTCHHAGCRWLQEVNGRNPIDLRFGRQARRHQVVSCHLASVLRYARDGEDGVYWAASIMPADGLTEGREVDCSGFVSWTRADIGDKPLSCR
jgi:hypothetical protein